MPRPFLDTSPGYLERVVPLQRHDRVRAQQGGRAAHARERVRASIVNISSAIGRLRDRGFVAYGTAKAALTHMTRLMAADLAPEGARQRDRGRVDRDERARDRARQPGDPRRDGAAHAAEAARASPRTSRCCALYLASPAGSFVTGKLFEVDGGLEEANLELGLPDSLATASAADRWLDRRRDAGDRAERQDAAASAVEEVVDLVGEGEAVLAAAPRHGRDAPRRARSVRTRAGTRPRTRRSTAPTRSSLVEPAGVDAQQHEIGNVAVEPVGDVHSPASASSSG